MAGHNKRRREGGLKLHDPRRHKWPLEKWPSAMLVEEIKLLRKERTAENPARGPTRAARAASAERDELVESLERAGTRTRYVEAELRAAREEAAAEGLGSDEIAGKPALAKYFSTWNRFVSGIWNLATVRAQYGMPGVRVAQERLMRYAFTLSVVGPRGEWEAGEGDRIIRTIQDDAFIGVLAWGVDWSDRFVVRFLKQASRALYRPSVWAIYEKSSEMGTVDRYGGATVMK